jgi:hypothetical protein
VRKLLRLVAAILLLPFCAALTLVLGDMLRTLQPASASAIPSSVWGLLVGFFLWIFLYFVMPRPVRSYVLAHELTHALWGWLMGARIRKLRVSSKGGSVALSDSNFLIELAPYFFPFYTMLVILLYGAVSLFWDQRAYEPLWVGFVGLTWGFHLTFTISALAEHQPDIQQNGRLFSYAVIYAMNLFGICLWVIAVASPTVAWFGARLFAETSAMYAAATQRTIRSALAAGQWLAGMLGKSQ